jgi:hypothetical protein
VAVFRWRIRRLRVSPACSLGESGGVAAAKSSLSRRGVFVWRQPSLLSVCLHNINQRCLNIINQRRRHSRRRIERGYAAMGAGRKKNHSISVETNGFKRVMKTWLYVGLSLRAAEKRNGEKRQRKEERRKGVNITLIRKMAVAGQRYL